MVVVVVWRRRRRIHSKVSINEVEEEWSLFIVNGVDRRKRKEKGKGEKGTFLGGVRKRWQNMVWF